jgi:hypothetical protein
VLSITEEEREDVAAGSGGGGGCSQEGGSQLPGVIVVKENAASAAAAATTAAKHQVRQTDLAVYFLCPNREKKKANESKFASSLFVFFLFSSSFSSSS